MGVRRLFTALSEMYVEGRFSQLTRTAFSRPYPPTPSYGFFFRLRALKETRLEPDYLGKGALRRKNKKLTLTKNDEDIEHD